ncbi:MAG TPA: riboflavin synthase [Candidatus Micrarchaeia archaeon]|nr:riboflavin synthase [Candidatus Micrarchaeia archaeon]
MFSGIVAAIGQVVEPVDDDIGRLVFRLPAVEPTAVSVGESVAVNGCCLTVTAVGADGDGAVCAADVMPETSRRTNLGRLRRGGAVNLERALRYQDPVGGHLVTGHVDATGTVTDLRGEGNAVRCSVAGPAAVMRRCVAQGSITIDGCALTVVTVGAAELVVSLIPHTRMVTIAGGYAVGTVVNLEADLVAKYVERLCRPWRPDGATAP